MIISREKRFRLDTIHFQILEDTLGYQVPKVKILFLPENMFHSGSSGFKRKVANANESTFDFYPLE
jgi:hypothetical protein